jgi:hypothetical protein
MRGANLSKENIDIMLGSLPKFTVSCPTLKFRNFHEIPSNGFSLIWKNKKNTVRLAYMVRSPDETLHRDLPLKLVMYETKKLR